MHKELITFDPPPDTIADPTLITGASSDFERAVTNWYSYDWVYRTHEEEFKNQRFTDSEVAEETMVFLPGLHTTAFAHEEQPRNLIHWNRLTPTKQLAREGLTESFVVYDGAVLVIGANLTTLLNPPSSQDPREEVVGELAQKLQSVEWTRRAYHTRIQHLREMAEEEDYSRSPRSEKDFWSFFESNPFVRQGNLVLLENGNLRAIWKDGRGTHIGLQFLGGQTIQFVIFKIRAEGKPVSRAYGRDNFEGVQCQIQAFELQSMMNS